VGQYTYFNIKAAAPSFNNNFSEKHNSLDCQDFLFDFKS
jgi:hypothetical protein